MIFRKIHIRDKIYNWKFIKNRILIFDPDGKKFIPTLSELTGLSNNDIERGQRRRYFSVLPSQVKEYIVKNIIEKR